MHGRSQLEHAEDRHANRRKLQSGCFVIDQSDLAMRELGTLRWAQVIGHQDAAQKLSCFMLRPAAAEVLSFALMNLKQCFTCNRGAAPFLSLTGTSMLKREWACTFVPTSDSLSLIKHRFCILADLYLSTQ